MATYPYPIRGDRRFFVNGAYSSGDDKTFFAIPIRDTTLDAAVLSDDFGADAGKILSVGVANAEPLEDTVSVVGDYSAGEVCICRAYDLDVQLTRPYPRNRSGNAYVDDFSAIKRLVVAHDDAGDYTLQAEQSNRATKTKVFSFAEGDIDGEGSTKWYVSGRIPDMTLSITSSSVRPVTISTVEYIMESESRMG